MERGERKKKVPILEIPSKSTNILWPLFWRGVPYVPPYQITMAAYDNGDYVFGERLMRSLFRSRENSIFCSLVNTLAQSKFLHIQSWQDAMKKKKKNPEEKMLRSPFLNIHMMLECIWLDHFILFYFIFLSYEELVWFEPGSSPLLELCTVEFWAT